MRTRTPHQISKMNFKSFQSSLIDFSVFLDTTEPPIFSVFRVILYLFCTVIALSLVILFFGVCLYNFHFFIISRALSSTFLESSIRLRFFSPIQFFLDKFFNFSVRRRDGKQEIDIYIIFVGIMRDQIDLMRVCQQSLGNQHYLNLVQLLVYERPDGYIILVARFLTSIICVRSQIFILLSSAFLAWSRLDFLVSRSQIGEFWRFLCDLDVRFSSLGTAPGYSSVIVVCVYFWDGWLDRGQVVGSFWLWVVLRGCDLVIRDGNMLSLVTGQLWFYKDLQEDFEQSGPRTTRFVHTPPQLYESIYPDKLITIPFPRFFRPPEGFSIIRSYHLGYTGSHPELRSQARLGLSSTVVSNHTGTASTVCFIRKTLRYMKKSRLYQLSLVNMTECFLFGSLCKLLLARIKSEAFNLTYHGSRSYI